VHKTDKWVIFCSGRQNSDPVDGARGHSVPDVHDQVGRVVVRGADVGGDDAGRAAVRRLDQPARHAGGSERIPVEQTLCESV